MIATTARRKPGQGRKKRAQMPGLGLALSRFPSLELERIVSVKQIGSVEGATNAQTHK